MNNRNIFIWIIFLFLFLHGRSAEGQSKHILIITGGKQIEREAFLQVFRSFSDITFDTTSKPGVFKDFASDKIRQYNALVFYDTYQPIDEEQKETFLRIFDSGIGCVFLHHSLVSHQDWGEYEKIVGGRYYHRPYVDNGKKYGPSTYKHDQDFTVKILDTAQAVTHGMTDFPICDEAYLNFRTDSLVTPLLISDNCENGKYLGWVHIYRKSRIVYIQLGHDHTTFENSDYRRLVHNAILWSAQ